MSTHDLVGTLNSLLNPRQRKTLKAVEPRGVLHGSRASVLYTPKGVQGGGIASPLTETDYAQREFHPTRYFTTVDGIFVWQIDPPAKFVMADANGSEVVQLFAVPT